MGTLFQPVIYAPTPLHVKKADESYCIGTEPLAGYLNVYALVDLAAATGCDAIHPK